MRRPGVRIPLPPAPKASGCRDVALANTFDVVHFDAASYDSTSRMTRFSYVYIIQSEIHPERFYSGLTDDLPRPVENHNSGRVLHTTKRRAWRLKTYIAF